MSSELNALPDMQQLMQPPHAERFSILAASADAVDFDRVLLDPAFAEIEAHPHSGRFGRAYHLSLYDSADRSFAICLNGAPALICLCAPRDGKLNYYGVPLRLIARAGLDRSAYGDAVARAFSHLDRLATADGLQAVVLRTDATRHSPEIEQACRSRGATASVLPVSEVDLTAGPAAWRKALRKSSRSLINWGKRTFAIRYVNKEFPDRATFDQYHAFHTAVAGRSTRSVASWNLMYDWIVRGGGELVLASLEDQLVAGSMFLDGTEISTYASAAYDRARFDKPLAHYPLWLGIERAHARGMKTLDLGPAPHQGTVPEKEYQIGYFKRGFATHFVEQTIWRWPPAPAGSG
jgi:Acetyltransferase (GNAT) domain